MNVPEDVHAVFKRHAVARSTSITALLREYAEYLDSRSSSAALAKPAPAAAPKTAEVPEQPKATPPLRPPAIPVRPPVAPRG